jgi:hypothetical protein
VHSNLLAAKQVGASKVKVYVRNTATIFRRTVENISSKNEKIM